MVMVATARMTPQVAANNALATCAQQNSLADTLDDQPATSLASNNV